MRCSSFSMTSAMRFTTVSAITCREVMAPSAAHARRCPSRGAHRVRPGRPGAGRCLAVLGALQRAGAPLPRGATGAVRCLLLRLIQNRDVDESVQHGGDQHTHRHIDQLACGRGGSAHTGACGVECVAHRAADSSAPRRRQRRALARVGGGQREGGSGSSGTAVGRAAKTETARQVRRGVAVRRCSVAAAAGARLLCGHVGGCCAAVRQAAVRHVARRPCERPSPPGALSPVIGARSGCCPLCPAVLAALRAEKRGRLVQRGAR